MVTVVTVTHKSHILSTMCYQLDKVIRDNIPYMITITLGSHAYTSELVQLSEQVGRELRSNPKKILHRQQNYPSPKTCPHTTPHLVVVTTDETLANVAHSSPSVNIHRSSAVSVNTLSNSVPSVDANTKGSEATYLLEEPQGIAATGVVVPQPVGVRI